jgi:hypothetical protein
VDVDIDVDGPFEGRGWEGMRFVCSIDISPVFFPFRVLLPLRGLYGVDRLDGRVRVSWICDWISG